MHFAYVLDVVDFVGGTLPFQFVLDTTVAEKGGSSMKWMKRSILGLLAAGALSLSLVGPATAQLQDGLVNVAVGDITILEDVNVAVAAQVIAAICDVNVGPVVVLGRAIDRSVDDEDEVCTIEDGNSPITIFQN
jgi:hypothetical protein